MPLSLHTPLKNGRDPLPETGYGIRMIVLGYVMVALVWILFTDHLTMALITSVQDVQDRSVYKGFLFVGLTGALLYVLISRLVLRLRAVTESLWESEEQLRSLVSHLHAGVVVHAPNGRILLSNSEASRLLGLSQERMLGKEATDPHWCFTDEAGNPLPTSAYPVARVIATGQPLKEQVVGIVQGQKHGKNWVLVNAYPEFDASGAMARVVVMFVDITERKEVEKQLRQLSQAVEQSPSSVVITDRRGNIQYINPKFTAVSGYCAQEVLGKSPRVLKSGEMPPEGYKALWETITSGREWRGEFHNRKKNGTLFWESASISPITDANGAITHFLALKEDITERKRTEEALRKSEEKFVKAFNTAPASVAILTLKEARYLEVNDAFEVFTGYRREEALGRTVLELNLLEEPNDLELLGQMIVAQGSLRNQESRYRTKGGDSRVGLLSADLIEVEGEPCIIYISLDITERQQMEEKFLRAQRMESIGALAGGMAHDLNNILAPIMMSASMLHEKGISEATRQHLIEGIEEAALRGSNIVGQVLTFARGVKGQHAVLDAQALVTQIGRIVRETFPKSILLNLASTDALWNITGDFTQLQQVLLNLCMNARDAMPEGGTLDMNVENIEVDATFAHMVSEAKPGCYVRFKVADSGMGMTRKVMDRIFEPFFTTKETGKGTGLGLSTAVGIVRSHGGFMKVDSEPGKGSVFHVFLPATTDAVLQADPVEHPSISRGHGETILVVDDEPEIVSILEAVLVQNGWNVVTASDGLEGVAAFLHHSDQIRAVVTDMVMPNLDGLGLIRSIRKLAPRLPILISSGYSNEESKEALSDLQVDGFLKKPFSARQIIAQMLSLLYGPAE